MIDYINVLCILLYNIKKLEWDDYLFDILSVFKFMFLEVKFLCEVYVEI